MRTTGFMVMALALGTFPVARGDDGPVRIVTTLTDLKDIAEAVGGKHVEATALVAGAQDPHFVDPKPSYIVRLREADLLIVNGAELEQAWLGPLIDNARNSRIQPGAEGYVDASIGIPLIEVPAAGTTRASGDIHALGNPHYLLDPLNGRAVARTIADAIIRIRPAAQADVEKGVKSFQRSLDEALFGSDLVNIVGGGKLVQLAHEGRLDAFLAETVVDEKPLTARLGGWLGRMKALRAQPILTYHRSFSYFVQRFGLTVADYVEPLPGITPSAKHLAELVGLIHAREIRAIVTHPFYDSKPSELLAAKTGVRVLVLPSGAGGAPGVDHYADVFEKTVLALEVAHAVAPGK